jgi:hypothetical protein
MSVLRPGQRHDCTALGCANCPDGPCWPSASARAASEPKDRSRCEHCGGMRKLARSGFYFAHTFADCTADLRTALAAAEARAETAEGYRLSFNDERREVERLREAITAQRAAFRAEVEAMAREHEVARDALTARLAARDAETARLRETLTKAAEDLESTAYGTATRLSMLATAGELRRTLKNLAAAPAGGRDG